MDSTALVLAGQGFGDAQEFVVMNTKRGSFYDRVLVLSQSEELTPGEKIALSADDGDPGLVCGTGHGGSLREHLMDCDALGAGAETQLASQTFDGKTETLYLRSATGTFGARLRIAVK